MEASLPINQSDTFITLDEKKSKKEICFDFFGLPYSKPEILAVIVFLIVGVSHCVIFQSYLGLEIVKNDTKRYPIFEILSILSPILAFYAAITFKMNQGPWINLALVLLLFVSPLVILIFIASNRLFFHYLRLSVACIFIPVSVVGFSLFKLIRKNLISNTSRLVGEIVMIALNILINLLFNLVFSVVLLDENTFDDPKIFVQYFATVYLVIITIVWGVIHSQVFKKQPNEIETLRMEILSSQDISMRVQVILNSHPNILNSPKESIFSKYGHFLASLGILISLICVEAGLLTIISEYKSSNYPDSALYLSIFYVFATPAFLFSGILFSSSKLITRDKFLVTLLFFSLIPTIFVMWLSYSLYTTDSLYYLGILIEVGFPGSLIYWISMSMIFQYNKRSFQYFSSIFCLIFLIPVGLIIPLYYAGGMKILTFWVSEGTLLLGGLIVLVLWFIQLLLKTQKEMFTLYKELSSFNSGDLAMYIYSFCFIFGYAIVSWTMFSKILTENVWTSGLLAGCIVILGLLIIDTLFLHRVSLYIKPSLAPEESIVEILKINQSIKTQEQEESLTKKKKIQFAFLIYGLVINLSISIPILVTNNSSSSESAGISIIVGGLSSMLIFIFLIEIKHFLKKFGQAVITYILGYCWLFCFIPVIVFIPITFSSTDNSSDQRSVTSWSIGSMLLLFMIGVSIVSITLNYLFRQFEYEKIAKLCCKQVQDMLTDNGVRASLINLRGIFDNYYNSSAQAVEKVLLAKTVYSYRVIDEKEPDLEYSKEILTLREINKLKSGNTEELSQNQKKSLSLLDCFRSLCNKKNQPQKENLKVELSPEELNGVNLETPQATSIQPSFIEENWEAKFKKDAEDLENAQKMLENNLKIKAEQGFVQPEVINLDNVQAVKLTKKRKKKLVESKELEYLLNNNFTKDVWLHNVFARFSSGMIGLDREPWMNLSDLRNFIRLCGLSNKINNANCDILYVSMTRRYIPSGDINHTKINFKEFCNKLLPQIAKMIKLKELNEELKNSLIKHHVYPHLVTNLPWLQLVPDDIKSEKIINENEINENEINEESNLEALSLRINPSDIPSFPQIQPAEVSFRMPSPKIFNNQIKETSKRVACSKCLDKFSNCSLNFFRLLIGCCGKIFDVGVDGIKQVDEKKNEVVKEKLELVERRESPEWDAICKLITEKFDESYKELSKGKSEKSVHFSLNLANFIGIFGHFVEVYSFSSVAFYDEVGWLYGSGLTKASAVILADSKYWVEIYWICFSASILFLILLYPTIRLLRQGRLGLNSDYTIAKFPSPNFFLSKFIGLFGKSMYFTIMCSLLGSFSCIYESNSWHLMRYSSIECFSNDHIPYFVLSIFTLLFYYPSATLLYPNLAYQDKALDIKFDTTYLVLESQGKVLIAAFAVFFAKEKYVWLQLIVSIIVSLTLFIICFKSKPCLVSSYNLWKAGGFLIPIWACSCALVNYYSLQQVLTLFLLVSGIGLILMVLIVIQCKFYWFNIRKARKITSSSTKVMKFSQSEKIDNDVSSLCHHNYKGQDALIVNLDD